MASYQLKKRTSLNVKEKLKIVEEIKEGKASRKELSIKYNVNLSTITRILQNESNWNSIVHQNKNLNTKRLRKGSHHDVDQAMTKWFTEKRMQNANITGPMLLEQAKKFAEILGVNNFEPNNGWLHMWKNRENINFHRIMGEKNDANLDAARTWTSTTLKTMLKDYSPDCVFNADETGLFYKALPQGTLAFAGEKVFGGKMQKNRLTILFVCNMDGTQKYAFVIGTPKNPRAFRNKEVPLPYFSQKKAWMVSEIWNQIMIDLNNKMKKQQKNILLLVDNAACHRIDVELSNIKIEFLPANTTSIIQPLDQGIIRSFKAQYKTCLVRKQLFALDNGQTLKDFYKEIDILKAIHMIKRAWGLVQSDTIKSCFRKAEFVKDHESVDDITLDNCEVESDNFCMSEEEFQEYVELDSNIQCYGEMTDSEIIEELLEEPEAVKVDDPIENEEICKNSIATKINNIVLNW
ncbi:tigger transposable element-derived protein 6-like [Condylostylus longicornis]|uniref:tigger transposable element-derived protein 6-like n=1 Tax=Condylostylus longicornis TaxID=2530218 RepID=UPI00244DDC65|nr:tigger transposable element-derived protein 6-like [Condylostylus longicornis]